MSSASIILLFDELRDVGVDHLGQSAFPTGLWICRTTLLLQSELSLVHIHGLDVAEEIVDGLLHAAHVEADLAELVILLVGH